MQVLPLPHLLVLPLAAPMCTPDMSPPGVSTPDDNPLGSLSSHTLLSHLQPILPKIGVMRVWALPSGVICHVDNMLRDSLGSLPGERLGHSVLSMAVDPTRLAECVAQFGSMLLLMAVMLSGLQCTVHSAVCQG